MLRPEELTPEMHKALIACYRIAAARGRQLRLAQMQAHEAGRDAHRNKGDADNMRSENSTCTTSKGAFEELEVQKGDLPHAEEEGTVYNANLGSPSPHEPMDHHH